MLLIGHSIEELSMCCDTVIFLLQHLGFVINWKKSVLTPVQEIEFLGLKINSVNLEISLTEEKIQKVKTKCQNLLTEPAPSIAELTTAIGLLTSTIQAVLPARLQCWYLQLQQLSSLKESNSYQQKIDLNHQSKTGLLWWITNLDLYNDRSLIQPPAQVLIHTDASKKGWRGETTCNVINRGNVVSPGNEIPHQYTRIISSKTSHTDIHKIQTCQSNTSSSRQYCGLNKFNENEDFSKSQSDRVGQGNLRISFEVGDHNYCRIPLKRTECSSRLGISKQFGLLRVDAESSDFSERLPNKGLSRYRFVCIPSITSDTNLRCMKIRSSQLYNRCISTELGTQIPACLSPVLHDFKSS